MTVRHPKGRGVHKAGGFSNLLCPRELETGACGSGLLRIHTPTGAWGMTAETGWCYSPVGATPHRGARAVVTSDQTTTECANHGRPRRPLVPALQQIYKPSGAVRGVGLGCRKPAARGAPRKLLCTPNPSPRRTIAVTASGSKPPERSCGRLTAKSKLATRSAPRNYCKKPNG